MKKIILSIFIINIALSIFLFLDNENSQIKKSLITFGEVNSVSLKVSLNIGALDSDTVVEKIKKDVKKYNGNIIYKKYNGVGNNDTSITSYVFLNDPSIYFSPLKIKGSVLNKYDESSNYLSTIKNSDSKNIGTLETLGSKDIYEVKTLDTLKNRNTNFTGMYYVSLENPRDMDEFIKLLNSDLNSSVTLDDGQHGFSMGLSISNIIPMIFLYILGIMAVIYSVFFRFKDIGIKKLNGYSSLKISGEYIKKITLLYIIAVAIVYGCFILAFLINKNNIFGQVLYKSIVPALLLFILTIVLLSIPLLIIKRVRVGEMLKNKKPTKIMSITNIFFKVLFSIIFIGILTSVIFNLVAINNFYSNNLKKWEETKNMAQLLSTYDTESLTDQQEIDAISKITKLKRYLNKNGAIQIAVSDDKNHPSVAINENYLKKNPIYDINNNKVNISGKDNVLYVLIPAHEIAKKNEILKPYKELYTTMMLKYKPADLHKYYPDEFPAKNPEVKAIIVKDNQKYFTYDITKYSETNNYIKDPIALISDYAYDSAEDVSTNSGIYFITDNAKNPIATISGELNKLGLKDGYTKAISTYDQVGESVYQYQNILNSELVFLFVVFTILIFIIAYTTILYMEKVKFESSIKTLNGFGFFKIHKKKLVLSSIMYLILIPIGYGLSLLGINFIIILSSIMIVFLLDQLETIIIIRIVNKKNIKDILKGN